MVHAFSRQDIAPPKHVTVVPEVLNMFARECAPIVRWRRGMFFSREGWGVRGVDVIFRDALVIAIPMPVWRSKRVIIISNDTCA